VLSRADILRAAIPGQRYSTVPWINPGDEILLRLSGWPKVERVLQLIDAVEALGIDPADAAPDTFITACRSMRLPGRTPARATRPGSIVAG
jgi:hypothetical protein